MAAGRPRALRSLLLVSVLASSLARGSCFRSALGRNESASQHSSDAVLGRRDGVLAGKDARAVAGAGIAAPLASVPDLAKFTEFWELFHRSGLQGRAARGKRIGGLPGGGRLPKVSVRMVVGIFTSMSQEDWRYRAVIRTTWMRQPGICDVKDVQSAKGAGCSVFATFVVGAAVNVTSDAHLSMERARGGRATVCSQEWNVTVLGIPESMNCGKSQAWFQYAVEQYGSVATHIAKMDMDAYLDLVPFMKAMDAFQAGCPYVYGGRPWHCPDEEYCPPLACGRPEGQDFWKYDSQIPDCWTYMQGGFYFMSVDLARGVSSQGGWWAQQSGQCLPEDAISGKAVKLFGQKGGSCLAVMNLLGKEAIWHADSPACWEPPYIAPE